MTNEQILLIKEILLNQKKDIEDIYGIEIQYYDPNNEAENESQAEIETRDGDEMDIVINSNIIDIEDKKNQQNSKKLKEIKTALEKIENNTYGICEESGDPINFERLKANPTARYSIEVQSLMESGRY